MLNITSSRESFVSNRVLWNVKQADIYRFYLFTVIYEMNKRIAYVSLKFII